jgi:hypothetical protein
MTTERGTPRRGDMLKSLMRQRQDAWARIEKHASLIDRAVDAMAALHRSIEPMEDEPDVPGRVPSAAIRAFVDALADIDRERCALKGADDGPGEEDGPWAEGWEKRCG